METVKSVGKNVSDFFNGISIRCNSITNHFSSAEEIDNELVKIDWITRLWHLQII